MIIKVVDIFSNDKHEAGRYFNFYNNGILIAQQVENDVILRDDIAKWKRAIILRQARLQWGAELDIIYEESPENFYEMIVKR